MLFVNSLAIITIHRQGGESDRSSLRDTFEQSALDHPLIALFKTILVLDSDDIRFNVRDSSCVKYFSHEADGKRSDDTLRLTQGRRTHLLRRRRL